MIGNHRHHFHRPPLGEPQTLHDLLFLILCQESMKPLGVADDVAMSRLLRQGCEYIALVKSGHHSVSGHVWDELLYLRGPHFPPPGLLAIVPMPPGRTIHEFRALEAQIKTYEKLLAMMEENQRVVAVKLTDKNAPRPAQRAPKYSSIGHT